MQTVTEVTEILKINDTQNSTESFKPPSFPRSACLPLSCLGIEHVSLLPLTNPTLINPTQGICAHPLCCAHSRLLMETWSVVFSAIVHREILLAVLMSVCVKETVSYIQYVC